MITVVVVVVVVVVVIIIILLLIVTIVIVTVTIVVITTSLVSLLLFLLLLVYFQLARTLGRQACLSRAPCDQLPFTQRLKKNLRHSGFRAEGFGLVSGVGFRDSLGFGFRA